MDPVSIATLLGVPIGVAGVIFGYLQWRSSSRPKDANEAHELRQIVVGGGGTPSGMHFGIGGLGLASGALAETALTSHGGAQDMAASSHHEALVQTMPADSLISNLGDIAGSLPVDAGEAHHAGGVLGWMGDLANVLT